jgi:hypothetical protein
MGILLDSARFGTVLICLFAAGSSGTGCYSSSVAGDDDDGDVADIRPDDARDAVDVRPEDGGADTIGPPFPTRFVLRLVSDIPEVLYVAAWDSSSSWGHWLTLLDGTTAMAKSHNCGICSCDDCPGCAVCGAPCMELTELVAGSSGVEYLWDGRRWTADGTCGGFPCEAPEPVPAGTYGAEFCWGTGRGGTLPCDESLVGEACANLTFTLPDPDGVVEYVIDNGG